jgi:hypothetical protein
VAVPKKDMPHNQISEPDYFTKHIRKIQQKFIKFSKTSPGCGMGLSNHLGYRVYSKDRDNIPRNLQSNQ